MPSYIKLETPKEVVPQILEMLSVAKDGGRVRKGVNETTKSIERKLAQLVVIASDVSPEEIVVHIPMLCDEKGIPYAFVPTRKDLGVAVGIEVGTSSISVENAGGASEALQAIIKKLPKSAHTTTPQQQPAAKAAPAAPAKEKAAPKAKSK